MTLRDELLQKQQKYLEEQNKLNQILDENNKERAQLIWNIVQKELKENTNQEEFIYRIAFSKTPEFHSDFYWKDYNGAEIILPTITIPEEIHFIYYPETYSTLPTFDFRVLEYDDDFMIKNFYSSVENKNEQGASVLYNYLEKELLFFQMFKQISNINEIVAYYEKMSNNFKQWPTQSLGNILILAMDNAIYRLGYDSKLIEIPTISSTYQKYVDEEENFILYQNVRNCVEISHSINKKKILQKTNN